MTTTHGTSTKEHDVFLKSVEGRDLAELVQRGFSHRSGTGISGIDRIYCNFGPAMQLDHQVHCEPLSWLPPLVSAHRPFAVGFSPTKDTAASGTPFMDDSTLRHPL